MRIEMILHFTVAVLYLRTTVFCLEEPCFTYNNITEWQRSAANKEFNYLCDFYITPGWYRVTSPAGEQMPTKCPSGGRNRCGAHWGYWLSSNNESYPEENLFPFEGQSVQRVACRATYEAGVCCDKQKFIWIRNCTNYLVYYLEPTGGCSIVYCFGDTIPFEYRAGYTDKSEMNSSRYTTTEEITTQEITTVSAPPSTTPCVGDGLNRTDAKLGDECGAYSSTAMCKVPHSACTETDRNSNVYQCKCAQGYVEKSSQCVKMPTSLFNDADRNQTLQINETAGQSVLAVDFSETTDLRKSKPEAKIIGLDSESFEFTVNTIQFTLRTKLKLTKMKYEITVIVSVQIDNVIVRDYVHVVAQVTEGNDVITKTITVLDGTPSGSTIGFICTACLEAGASLTPKSDIISVAKDGSVRVIGNLNLDRIQSPQTIAYSTKFDVSTQSGTSIAKIKLFIVRRTFIHELPENSNNRSVVGVFNFFDQPNIENIKDTAFNIDSKQSLTLGTNVLNFNKSPKVEKTLTVNTGDGTFNINVSIPVIDVNNNVPIFQESSYSYIMLQTIYPDLIVGFVKAEDEDKNATIMYTISPSDKLQINSNGVISIKSAISEGTYYNTTVTASDGKFSSDVAVNFTIIPGAEQNLNKTFKGSIVENGDENAYVTNVFVSGYGTYYFTDESALLNFRINQSTGVITTTENSFDREKHQTVLSYTVVGHKKDAQTCTLVVIGEVKITINDTNDVPPAFDLPTYNATVQEGDASATLSMVQISTTDEDLSSDPTTYSIFTHTDKFSIDNKGVMKTKIALDRETNSYFVVIVEASDGLNKATVNVTVHVLDVNDEIPQFIKADGFSIREDTKVGSVVSTISATDKDEGKNAEITYALDSKEGFFKINQTSGDIITLRNLDREKNSTHIITVYARDNGDTINSVEKYLTVTITDVNDNSPKFSRDEITERFNENESCNTVIVTVNATDADQQDHENSNITYSIVSGGDNFTIDRISGDLKCIQPFDYEELKSQEVQIRATDNGNPKLSSEQNVTVIIQDVNDNAPKFKEILGSAITIRYVVNSSLLVRYISATDDDSGENGKITFIISGNATSFLTIDQNIGLIRTKKIDKNNKPLAGQYQLNITARDGGSSSMTAFQTVHVSFFEINTQAVRFKNETINMTIQENKANGTIITSVNDLVKRDPSITLTYKFVELAPGIPFAIDSHNGMVSVSANIDRELIPIYKLVVKVENTINNLESDLSLVWVSIGDVNDNKPIFERQREYNFKVREDKKKDEIVTADVENITATDADAGINAEIKFAIVGENQCKNSFRLLERSSGMKTVDLILKEEVDYETIQSCRFSVTATNPNKTEMSSTAKVLVRITDYNDNTPIFSKNSYDITIKEDTTINSEMIFVGKVTDEDDRENGDVDLTVNDECWFKVEKDGDKFGLRLKEKEVLDYESNVKPPQCTITAEDKAISPMPKLHATATVRITLTDVNDNKPMFDNSGEIDVTVSRDADVGHTIVDAIPASDKDSGENGELKYAFRDSEYTNWFFINSSDGRININSPLDSVKEDEIVLTVIVSDKGDPSLYNSKQVKINITDENPRPYFLSPESETITEHSTRTDGVIKVVVAYDRKTGKTEKCDCLYYLDTSREDIVIEQNTGTIKFKYSNGSLDREKERNGKVILGVIAGDKGTPPKNSSTMQFVIEIKDINDQTPSFADAGYTFTFPQNTRDGDVIGQVVATDPDVEPKTIYSINLTQSNSNVETNVVKINPLNGTLTKHGNTTLASAEDAEITGYVSARDGEDDTKPSVYAQIIMKIEYDDKNRHQPQFSESTYHGQINWDSSAPKSILQVNATDADEDVQGEIHYSISNGNTREFFKIDNDGVVSLAYLLDSSLGSGNKITVNLTVKAEDRGIVQKSSSATVRIVIIGNNPGVCVQGAEHTRQLVDLESERNKWTYALYGLVAALCLSIIVCCVIVYKWRTSIPSSGEEPLYKREKQYAGNPEYADLNKRSTVEYSQSNQAFDPPSPHFDFQSGPEKDEYTRIEEKQGATSSFKDILDEEEPNPDYSPEGRRKITPVMSPHAPSAFNPLFSS